MHTANCIEDGFFEIRQDAATNRIELFRYHEKVKEIQPGRMLTLDELHETLLKERAEMFMEGI
ncbi:MAG: hypothetical protein IKY16_02510 [Bacteroidales bacterium]|nr:hypothetical protein [Bacteroidales bacterium]